MRSSSGSSTLHNALAVRVISALVVLLAVGCDERGLRPVHSCTTYEVGRTHDLVAIDTVDLLFVIDDSYSMGDEQALLRQEIPRLVQVLASGDRGPRRAPFSGVRLLHVGVISGDMGAGDPPSAIDVPSCRPGLGGDGILRSARADCAEAAPWRVFTFESRTDDASVFAGQVDCALDVGTGGCGFGQPLEAALKALSPASPTFAVAEGYVAPTFESGFGHGGPGDANDGFLRPDSILAIVLLTNDDDCSATSHELFYSTEFGGTANPLNLRCSRFPDALYPIDRYVDGFAQLRNNPRLLVFGAIVGIPAELASSYVGDYDAMLAEPRLDFVEVDIDARLGPDVLAPSCDGPSGQAYPPRRIVELAGGLARRGAITTVQSVCDGSYAPAFDAIIDGIANALDPNCLPRALELRSDGSVDCELYELLPSPLRCEDVGLRWSATERYERSSGEVFERELCFVPQILPAEIGTASGWYYDDFSDEVIAECSSNASPQRIGFSLFEEPSFASTRLNCTDVVPPSGEGVAQLGTFCAPHGSPPENLCSLGAVPSRSSEHAYVCDPLRRTCGVPCASDRDCTAAGLPSFVCDDRAVLDVLGGHAGFVPDVDGDGDIDGVDADVTYGFCVNPFC